MRVAMEPTESTAGESTVQRRSRRSVRAHEVGAHLTDERASAVSAATAADFLQRWEAPQDVLVAGCNAARRSICRSAGRAWVGPMKMTSAGVPLRDPLRTTAVRLTIASDGPSGVAIEVRLPGRASQSQSSVG